MRFVMIFCMPFFLLSCFNSKVEEETIDVSLDIYDYYFDPECYMHFTDENIGYLFTNPLCIYKTKDGGKTWKKEYSSDSFLINRHIVVNNILYGAVKSQLLSRYIQPFCYDFKTGLFYLSKDSLKTVSFIDFLDRKGKVSMLCESGNLNSNFFDDRIQIEYLNNKNRPIPNGMVMFNDLLYYCTCKNQIMVCDKDNYKEFSFPHEEDLYFIVPVDEKMLISTINKQKKEIRFYLYDKNVGSFTFLSKISGCSSCSNLRFVGNVLVVFVGWSYKPDIIYYSYDKGLTWQKYGSIRRPKLNCVYDNKLLIFQDKETLTKIEFKE